MSPAWLRGNTESLIVPVPITYVQRKKARLKLLGGVNFIRVGPRGPPRKHITTLFQFSFRERVKQNVFGDYINHDGLNQSINPSDETDKTGSLRSPQYSRSFFYLSRG